MVVKAEDLKKMVPATRVDPAVGRRTPAAASPEPTAGTALAKPRSGFPVVPVAAGVVLLAIGGGAIALKGTLFGTAADPAGVQTPTNLPPDSTADSTSLPGGTTNPGTTPGTTTMSKPDSTPGGRTGTTPPRANSGRDSAQPPRRDSAVVPRPIPPDAVELERQLDVYYNEIGFEDDPAKRVAAKQLGERIFGIRTLPDKLRAKAAFVLYQAYLSENRAVAKDWLDKAVQLDPKDEYRNQLRIFN